MATKKKAVAKKTSARGGGGGSWESALAAEAEKTRGAAAAAAPKGGGAPRLGIRGGVLALNGKEVKGNKLECVLLDFIHENAYYEGAFDPENPLPPVCYALGRDEADLEPSAKAEEQQNDACDGCPNNEFGSAEVGRGKACKNSYRLAVWVPDEENDDGDPLVIVVTAKLTVFKGLEDYIEQCITDLRRPYYTVLTELTTAPDRKSQYRLEFNAVDKLGKAGVTKAKKLRDEKVEELLFSEFPTREAVESRRAARRDSEQSAKRQSRMTRGKQAAKKKTVAKKKGVSRGRR